MNINSHKLIKLLLPTFMRGNRIIEFIRVMLLQLENSYNTFNANVPDWLYKANANASVISLTHHVKRELDVDILITELDGTPIDFLVTVQGFVDYGQLSKLIDTYGLAGKSYVFENGEITYTCEWINHVCAITLANNALTLSLVDSVASVSAAQTVASELKVAAVFNIRYSTPVYHTFTIDSGGSISELLTLIGKVVESYSILSIIPSHDYQYNYIGGSSME